jgi:hypothetical protein
MASDMLKARNAIKLLRQCGDCGTLGQEHVDAIADLCDTFEWLDESRNDAIKEQDRLRNENRIQSERIGQLADGIAAMQRDASE